MTPPQALTDAATERDCEPKYNCRYRAALLARIEELEREAIAGGRVCTDLTREFAACEGALKNSGAVVASQNARIEELERALMTIKKQADHRIASIAHAALNSTPSPVGERKWGERDEDYTVALDCAASQFETYAQQDQIGSPEQRRKALDDSLQHALGVLSMRRYRAMSKPVGERNAARKTCNGRNGLSPSPDTFYAARNVGDGHFLEWLHARMECVYHESPNRDFMIVLADLAKNVRNNAVNSERNAALEEATAAIKRLFKKAPLDQDGTFYNSGVADAVLAVRRALKPTTEG